MSDTSPQKALPASGGGRVGRTRGGSRSDTRASGRGRFCGRHTRADANDSRKHTQVSAASYGCVSNSSSAARNAGYAAPFAGFFGGGFFAFLSPSVLASSCGGTCRTATRSYRCVVAPGSEKTDRSTTASARYRASLTSSQSGCAFAARRMRRTHRRSVHPPPAASCRRSTSAAVSGIDNTCGGAAGVSAAASAASSGSAAAAAAASVAAAGVSGVKKVATSLGSAPGAAASAGGGAAAAAAAAAAGAAAAGSGVADAGFVAPVAALLSFASVVRVAASEPSGAASESAGCVPGGGGVSDGCSLSAAAFRYWSSDAVVRLVRRCTTDGSCICVAAASPPSPTPPPPPPPLPPPPAAASLYPSMVFSSSLPRSWMRPLMMLPCRSAGAAATAGAPAPAAAGAAPSGAAAADGGGACEGSSRRSSKATPKRQSAYCGGLPASAWTKFFGMFSTHSTSTCSVFSTSSAAAAAAAAAASPDGASCGPAPGGAARSPDSCLRAAAASSALIVREVGLSPLPFFPDTSGQKRKKTGRHTKKSKHTESPLCGDCLLQDVKPANR